ncbi:MAG: hypothetical protein Q9185_002260 [Variospora sp. 1 TL-2023]
MTCLKFERPTPLPAGDGARSHSSIACASTQDPEEDEGKSVVEPIAVIGLSLTFPQKASSPETFWQMLMEGESALTHVPRDRYDWEGFFNENAYRTGTTNVNKAHFVAEDIAAFDAPFFSVTPEEAACMDPQQRLLLETAYRAFENAGVSLEQAAGSKTSVHIGSFNSDYSLLLQKDLTTPKRYLGTGTEAGMLANRLSWFFGLKGPSMQGLVGGCNLFFNPEPMCAMSDMNFLSPDGISYAFDHRANGYSRGEGLGLVVIKPLSKAIKDGDTVRAVIRATGSNQDGRTPGTGTALGDPIEARAINECFGRLRSRQDKLIVGALKPNIGHLEGASGIASLIKTILVLESGLIPRNIWLERVNPQIPLDEWNIMFPTQNELTKDDKMSRLGESSFSQPICTALQIALVKLLRSWNVVPAAVIGHSSGEIAAAFCSGAISDVHALRIAYLRGLATSRRVCDGEGGEAMMAVGLSDANIQDPRNTTLSGTKSQLVALQQKLILDGIFARLLPVNCAYHSKSMTSVGIDYLQLLQSCPSSPAGSMKSTMISSVSGRSISADELRSEEYWVRNLMSPVRFAAALQQLFESVPNTNAPAQESSITPDFLVEIGPSATLRTSIRETLADLGKANDIGYGSILVKGSPAVETAMHLAGSLHSRGCPVNLLNVNCLGQASQPRMLIDLPGYPFDHSQRYWIESRLSKNFRFRQHEHELLGNAVTDWNPLDARWRKIFKSSENEWMADHKVNGSILLPAAAFMAMAIEAAKRLIHPDQEVLAYRIQNATFTTAIVLSPDEDGTEVEMRLGQDYGYVEESRQSLRRIFQLFVLAGQEWSECSHGTVILDYQTRAQPLGAEMSVQEKEVCDSFIAKCTKYLHSQHLYPSLRSAGMQYGPTFQTLTSVAVSDRGGEATGVVRPKVRGASILHPTMLDGIFQLMFPALQGKSELLSSAMLPTRVDNLWISAQGAADTSEELAVQAHAHGLVHGFRHAEFSMVGRELHSGATVISTTGFRAVFMTDTPQGYRPHASKKLCYNVDWRPAISQLDNPAISALCRTPVKATQDRASKDFLRLAAGVFITKALRDERSHQVPLKSLWHQKYTAWMHHALAVLHADNPTYSGLRWVDILTRHELQDQILSELKENVSPICPLYVKIGSRLPDILAGRLDALTYLFDDEQLTRFYANHLRDHITSKMSAYVDLSTHQNPNIRILEVGAGTGGMTKAVLKHLFQGGASETGTPRFANYTYTDISASFVESFQNIFKGNEHRAVFRTLDVEKDPAAQGIECGSYDLVLACNVRSPSSWPLGVEELY